MWTRKSAAIAFLLAMMFVTPVALAQKPADDAPKYDVAKEVTIKGTVDDVKQVPNAKGQIGIRLTIKTATETLEVRLCPNSFLKEFDVNFKPGDELTITGSKVQVNDKPVILAREIEAGNNKIVLRDKQGEPVWLWLTKGGSR